MTADEARAQLEKRRDELKILEKAMRSDLSHALILNHFPFGKTTAGKIVIAVPALLAVIEAVIEQYDETILNMKSGETPQEGEAKAAYYGTLVTMEAIEEAMQPYFNETEKGVTDAEKHS